MFKEDLFNAVIEVRKTQTRRIIKNLITLETGETGRWDQNWFWKVNSRDFWSFSSYEVGETVYLKEAFWDYGYYHPAHKTKAGKPKWISLHREFVNDIIYCYDCPEQPGGNPFNVGYMAPIYEWKKCNKMYMPELAARHFIKFKRVWVERVQDITRSSIRAEGLQPPKELCSDDIEPNYKQWLLKEWIELWNSINKSPYSWQDNPFVWVYEFELLTQQT